MKSTTILCSFLILSLSLSAQHKNDKESDRGANGNTPPATDAGFQDFDDEEDRKSHAQYHPTKNKSKTAAVLWSEDFSSGFAGSSNGAWTTSGANSNLITVDTDGPDSLLQFGWGPIPSPTAANGFAIMDWYRRIPDQSGFATSPAEGLLTSPVIDLGNNSDVFLSFYQQIYWCCNLDQEIFVEVSTDGGLTWPHKYKTNITDRNNRHWNIGYGYYFEYDISSAVVADPSNVRIRFNWTSLTADANGQYSNAYFWMIDDIEISELPRHKVKFTEWQSAPAKDIIFNGSGLNSKTGHFTVDELKPITFDCNVFNFGSQDQTGVDLMVELFDEQGNLAGSVRSNNSSTLLKGDTLNYSQLTTDPWTPSWPGGNFTFVYTIISDSIPTHPESEAVSDSFQLFVTDSTTSLDFGTYYNTIGTSQLGYDGSAIASRFTFTSWMRPMVYGLQIDYGTATVAGGDIQIEVYDSTGFTYTGGFGGTAIISKAFTLGLDADSGKTVTYDLTTNGIPITLTANTLYFVVYMFSNAGANPIAISNDQSFPVQNASSIMFNADDNRWYSHYTDSRTLNAPFIRSLTQGYINSVEEVQKPWLEIYPNPGAGKFDMTLDEGGNYSINLIDMKGQQIDQRTMSVNGSEPVTLDYTTIPSGTYLLNISKNGEAERTAKIVIQ